jgi:hypothetical protein
LFVTEYRENYALMKASKNSTSLPADSRIVEDKLGKAAFAPSGSCLAMLLAIFIVSVATFYGALRHFNDGSQLDGIYHQQHQDIAGVGPIGVSHIPIPVAGGAGDQTPRIPFDADSWPLYEPPPVLFQRPSQKAPPSTAPAGSPVPSTQHRNDAAAFYYDREKRRMFNNRQGRATGGRLFDEGGSAFGDEKGIFNSYSLPMTK